MLKEQFLGRNPTHFQINPLVKAFIISEALIWSAWNFVIPIFSIFVVSKIPGANIELAGFGYSIYLASRVVFELISGRMLVGTNDKKKLIFAISGLSLITLSYIGFIGAVTIQHVYFFYFLAGMGLGISAPAKMALFSMHLDKNKEATEWGFADGIQFMFMAMAAALGGLIANNYGFTTLFVIAAVVNIIGVIPYTLYVFDKD